MKTEKIINMIIILMFVISVCSYLVLSKLNNSDSEYCKAKMGFKTPVSKKVSRLIFNKERTDCCYFHLEHRMIVRDC